MNKYTTSSLSLVLLFAFFQCSEVSRQKRRQKIKQQQYFVEGQRLYEQHCSSCHQTDGSGLSKLIPPISTLYISNNIEFVACGIKYGMSGPLQIGDILFDNKMPANKKLSDLEIAEIMTFTQSKWGQKDTLISLQTINKALLSCD